MQSVTHSGRERERIERIERKGSEPHIDTQIIKILPNEKDIGGDGDRRTMRSENIERNIKRPDQGMERGHKTGTQLVE